MLILFSRHRMRRPRVHGLRIIFVMKIKKIVEKRLNQLRNHQQCLLARYVSQPKLAILPEGFHTHHQGISKSHFDINKSKSQRQNFLGSARFFSLRRKFWAPGQIFLGLDILLNLSSFQEFA